MKQVIDPHLQEENFDRLTESTTRIIDKADSAFDLRFSMMFILLSLVCSNFICWFTWFATEKPSPLTWSAGLTLLNLIYGGLTAYQARQDKPSIPTETLLVMGNLLMGSSLALMLGFLTQVYSIANITELTDVVNQHHSLVLTCIIVLALAGIRIFKGHPIAFFAYVTPVATAHIVSLVNTNVGIINIISAIAVLIAFVVFTTRPSKSDEKSLLAEKEIKSLAGYIKRAQQKNRFLSGQLNEESRYRKSLQEELMNNQADLERKIAERTRQLSETNELLNQQVKLRHNISDALAKSQARLSQAIEVSKLGLLDWDVVGNRIYQSQLLKCFGKKDWDTKSYAQHLKSLCPPEDYERIKNAVVNYLNGDTSYYKVSFRVFDKEQNSWLWVEDQGKAIKRDKNGNILRFLGTRRDITQERKQEEQLHLAKSVFDQTSDGIFVLDKRFQFVSVNSAFQKITGRTEKELRSKDWMTFSSTPQKFKVFQQARIQLAQDGQWEAELFEKRNDGEYFPMRLQVNCIYDTEGDINYYAGIVSDLTSGKEADEKLRYLLNYDELTGLTNRVQFKDRMHNALLRARNGLDRFALICIDIDRFKHINQSLGPEFADGLLKTFANRLAGVMNKADTISRLGDDEFAVIIQAKNRDQAAEYAQAILKEVAKPFNEDGNELRISTSLGITLFPGNGRELPLIMRQANLATRQAKYLGGNNYQFFSEKLQDFSKFRLSVESDLRKALANDELEVYYQPKLNLHNNKIESVEALVRWNHPNRGLIVPADFVNIAEESGLIADLGADVLRAACQQAQQWRKQGIGDIKVSVNLSAHQLRQKKIVNTVYNILQLTHLPPSLLELELTESSIIENIATTNELLQEFCSMGISLSVDDFGTGYSSFSYLKKLPVDTIKIDRMFIHDLHTNEEDAAICKAIIVLGQNLNLQVVAEGVENEAQMAFLQDADCDLVQGFLVSCPLNAEEMTQLLTQQQAGLLEDKLTEKEGIK